MQGILVLLDQAGTAIAQLQEENRQLREALAAQTGGNKPAD